MDRDTENRTLVKGPHPEIALVAVPSVVFPAYQHLPFALCRDAALFTWVEVWIRLPDGETPSTRYQISTSSGKEDWARHFRTNRAYEVRDGCAIFRVDIQPRLEVLWEFNEERKVNLSVTVERDGEAIYEEESFLVNLQRVDRALIRHVDSKATEHDVSGLFPVFVTPSDKSVYAFFGRTEGISGGGDGSSASVSGRRASAANVPSSTRSAREIYELIRDNGCTFITADNPARVEGLETQLVKFPARTLVEKSGNCLDWAVLFATLMEHVKHDPRIVVLLDHNHAIAGWRPEPDSKETRLVDISGAAKQWTFEKAVDKACELYDKSPPDRRVVVDVRRRRDADPSVTPFTLSVPSRELKWNPLETSKKKAIQEELERAAAGKRRPTVWRWVIAGLAALVTFSLATAWLLGWFGEPVNEWPAKKVVLVAPFTTEPERPADEVLFPLVDRMVFNALEAEEHIYRRLRRVDPADIHEYLSRQSLSPPLSMDQIDELADEFNANIVLQGSIRREGGKIRLEAVLRKPGHKGGVPIVAAQNKLVEAAYQLAGEAASQLSSGTDGATGTTDFAHVLLKSPDAAAILATVGPRLSTPDRFAAYRLLANKDPDAIGPYWYQFLDYIDSSKSAQELVKAAETVTDGNLRLFLEEAGDLATRGTACEGVDFEALAKNYPATVAPLAEAVCLYRQGKLHEALRLAHHAARRPEMRFHAIRVVITSLYSLPCEQVVRIRQELQELTPENVTGWSALGNWYAKCARLEDASNMVAVSSSMMPDDQNTRRYEALHQTHIQLLSLDLTQARKWWEELEELSDEGSRDFRFYALRSLLLSMQGHFKKASGSIRAGYDALRAQALDRVDAGQPPGNGFHMLALSRFVDLVNDGKIEEAAGVVGDFARVYANSGLGNKYWHDCLELALGRMMGKLSHADALAKMATYGDRLEAAWRRKGTTERMAQECLYHTYFGRPEDAAGMVFKAPPGNTFLGGCHYHHAQRLMAEGQAANAANHYFWALNDIIFGKTIGTELIPKIILGRARALRDSGQTEAAAAMYQRLIDNYAELDTRMPEAEAAQEELLDLR